MDLGVVKNKTKKWIISTEIPDGPTPQQCESDPISGLTGLCVYFFYPNLFPPKSNKKKQKKQKNNQTAPLTGLIKNAKSCHWFLAF